MWYFYLEVFLLIILSIWAIIITSILREIIFKKLKFTEYKDNNLKDQFKPFERYDRENWNIKEIYLCAIFLLPIRITCLVSIMIITRIVQFILKMPSKINQEYTLPKWKFVLH